MCTKEQAYTLLQLTYYDGIDEGDMTLAASALHEDVEWSHEQVWAHHEFKRGEPSTLRGRAAVQAFLLERVRQLAEAGIRHRIREMAFEEDHGAVLGEVVGEDGTTKPFIVWFEVRDDRIARYLLRPL